MTPRLVDTNILLRRAQKSHPMSVLAGRAIQTLRARGELLCMAPQNLIEFWNVATHPANMNGLGLSPAQAGFEIDELERLFQVLTEVPGTYALWRRLVVACGVSGRQVHDAHLVTTMLGHGVSRMLTFNDGDFARYNEILALNPSSV